jgi:hypothetical protein
MEMTSSLMISDVVAKRWTRWDPDLLDCVHEDPRLDNRINVYYYDDD